jgi:hypothetical protein
MVADFDLRVLLSIGDFLVLGVELSLFIFFN